MRILDLYSGAGGAAMGYHRAGWDVVGVDHAPQPHYPFEFHQAEAIDVLESWLNGGEWAYRIGERVDAVHASPPCQAYSQTQRLHGREHPRLIEETRLAIDRTGIEHYIIENVEGARGELFDPVLLCGSLFGLEVRRHRLFECSFPMLTMQCQHPTEKKYPTHARKDKTQLSPFVQVYGTGGGAGKDIDLWRRAMDVPWMQTKAEISEAIPPAYTEFIGAELIRQLSENPQHGTQARTLA